MVLEGDESGGHGVHGFEVGEVGEDDAVDFLDDAWALRDDGHGVPLVVFAEGLECFGVGETLECFFAAGFERDFFAREREVAASLDGGFGVVPESHFVVRGDFHLIAAHECVVGHAAADLNAGVATGKLEAQT